MAPDDSVPMTQHWEGHSPKIKTGMAGKSGRLAPRWVQDLLNSELDVGTFANIQWDPNARCSRKAAPHTLATVGNQSTAEGRDTGILSCVCTACDFHFLIRTAYDPDHLVCLCQPDPIHFPPKETDYYLHHLVSCLEPAHGHDQTDEYHPVIRDSLIACENFACSAPRCTFKVTVEISRPRLKRDWVQLLTDQQRIRDNLARAREQAPDRFKDARDDWCSTAPSTLNTYLRDLLDKSNPRSISQRNKRFQVVFGEECYGIFKAIQFSEEALLKDGVQEPYFIPPTLESGAPGTPTKLHTLRAVVEDMQAETENLISRGKSGDGRPPAGNRLSKELQCLNYPRNKVTPPLIEAHRILGVLPDFDKALMFYAYNRQSALCEERRPDYVQALRDIAQETADDEFQTRAIQELTMVERLPTATQHGAGDELQQQAYSFFSLQYTATDDAVITAFNKKLEHSPSQADSAREMLQIIGRHRSNERILNHASGPMDLSTAYRVLEVEPEWDNPTIAMMSNVKRNKNPDNKANLVQIIEALEVVAGTRIGDELIAMLGDLRADLARMNQQAGSTQTFSVNAGIVHETTEPRLDLPAGIKNIGNTCYLNSILQYLRTVVPVRELLSCYSEYELGHDESDIAGRRIGSAKVKIETAEAVIARIFVDELDKLLKDLDNTKERAIQPTQRLANAVLLPTDQIREDSDEETKKSGLQTQEVLGAHFPLPPPLPARPAPVPPNKNVDHVEDVNMVNVTVDPVSEDASSVSSQTLVSMPDADHDKRDENKSDIRLVPSFAVSAPEMVTDGGDAQMTGVDTPVLSVEERVSNALKTQKRSSGTDQQDVEEVMGSIINRLQAAIRPSHIGEDGIQWDPIMKTFFFTQAFHTRLATQETFKSDPPTMERSIAAYPAEAGPSTIQEALSRNLDLQRVEGDIVRFMSIGNLPPILHVLIQRTSYDGRKNMNPVEVSEMLYLDRYMHTEENEELFKLRQKGWALQQRLEQLSGISKTSPDDTQIIDSFVHDFVQIDRSDIEDSSSLLAGQPSSSLSFAGEEPSFPTYTPQSEPTFEKVDPPVTAGADFAGRDQINSMREDETKRHKAELEELFSHHKEQAYCLHAVICHSGQMNAGHYWVWIHDFEDGIWRKYNDETVTENANTQEVLNTLNSNGDPYYLCYVREEKKLDLIRGSKRNISRSSEGQTSSSGPAVRDTDGDIELIDVSDAKPDLGSGIPEEATSRQDRAPRMEGES